jgi:cellulose synthase/poly-beta-1,6-N-acetylglucosamine synthase-like glycosyltransferase
MGFLRSSYWATGGYQNLPFSLTEDYLLFAEILKKGYGWQWVHESATCNQTEPVDSFLDLLQQKKRGFEGGKQGPLAPALLFFYYALFYPILVIFFCFFIGSLGVGGWYFFIKVNA